MYEESIGVITYDVKWHWKVCVKFTQVLKVIYLIKELHELGHMLLLDITRMPYMGSPMPHLT